MNRTVIIVVAATLAIAAAIVAKAGAAPTVVAGNRGRFMWGRRARPSRRQRHRVTGCAGYSEAPRRSSSQWRFQRSMAVS